MNTNAAKSPTIETSSSRVAGARWIRAHLDGAPIRPLLLLRDREILAWVLTREGGLFQAYRPPAELSPDGCLNLVRDGALVGIYSGAQAAQAAAEAAILLSDGRV